MHFYSEFHFFIHYIFACDCNIALVFFAALVLLALPKDFPINFFINSDHTGEKGKLSKLIFHFQLILNSYEIREIALQIPDSNAI